MSGTSMSVIIALGAFSAIFGIAYVFMMTRHRERISMIDKGVDASIFVGKNNPSLSPTLKFGMLSVGIALGIITANILRHIFYFEKGIAFTSMIFLFGGLSLIANFLIERKLDRKE
ncbi:DUF6249 domain-containing protein [Dyadobacter sp. CY356]|uniref:DUF6249 domain-containing protein n=1 Tax=Dyadobacter sp. CY356 TaxID=2906442 RepID=UPI001F1F9166|nr:DUF6249 domain-containing protein [Dyadobacter sp. CY356]MCF0056233.1 hypothetical protein [Dyadobacter sp. CY356]